MAFCRKCGKEINDDAVICVHCGCATEKAAQQNNQNPNYDPDSNADFVEILLSVLIPIAGIIMYFVKKDTRPKAAKTCLLVGIITWALGTIAMTML
ncbi:zinc ribbon domain-containing protein [Ruminococcus sp.]|uniref:zinc-ribbon domain-containing protein n=1 Tax=Ruminococcus sp. TaxID=41978 RepID=UPI0025DC8D44|nr:zinc ribbon domain-containing protein [Ruminococcus sp.]